MQQSADTKVLGSAAVLLKAAYEFAAAICQSQCLSSTLNSTVSTAAVLPL